MRKHILTVEDELINAIFNTQTSICWKFFKKKPSLILQLSVGDLIYLRSKSQQVIGQFKVSKFILIECDHLDGIKEVILKFESDISYLQKEKYRSSKCIILLYVSKLTRFLTPPLIKPGKQDWIVL